MIFSALALGGWIGVVLGATRAARRTRRPVPAPAAAPREVVALCPARDELEVIDEALDGLLGQGLGEVVVVDDGSRDGTRARLEARAAGGAFRVLDAPELAPGARGKPAALAFAIEQLGRAPRWLLFVDADVRLAPGAAAALVALAETEGWDLVSAHPRQRLGSLLEQIAMPAVGALVLLAHPPHRVDAARPFANGQLLLVRRARYLEAGGHRAVSGAILEDVRLAERVAAAGGRLACVDGDRLAETRMYASLGELWRGWEKNLYLLLGGRPGPVAARVGLASVLAWSGPVAALVDGAIGVAAWALILVAQAILRSRGGAAPWGAALAPLGSVFATALAASSAWRHLGGGPLRWKGRRYAGEGSDADRAT